MGLEGLERGRRETGGVPKVMQWMRLKPAVELVVVLFVDVELTV